MRRLGWLSAAVTAVGLALVFMGAAQTDGQSARSAELSQALAQDELVRLHIIASDDSEEAQGLKLRVRDALLAAYGPALSAQESRSGALEFLQGELENIEAIARGVLRAGGADYGARARLHERDFPDREYEGVRVPAGRYMALDVELGGAQGRNWWCVIYPALCAPPPDVPADGGGVVFYSAVWDWLSGALGV